MPTRFAQTSIRELEPELSKFAEESGKVEGILFIANNDIPAVSIRPGEFLIMKIPPGILIQLRTEKIILHEVNSIKLKWQDIRSRDALAARSAYLRR